MNDRPERRVTPGRRPAAAAWLILSVVVASAGGVLAQTTANAPFAVRSGNHADFARLVIVYPDRRRWSLLPTDQGFALDVEGSAGFVLSEVFDLIPRDRIGSLTVDADGRLDVAVACDCHPEVIELPGRGLVLDIRDGPAPDGNPFAILRADPADGPSSADSTGTLAAPEPPVVRPAALEFPFPPSPPRLSFELAPEVESATAVRPDAATPPAPVQTEPGLAVTSADARVPRPELVLGTPTPPAPLPDNSQVSAAEDIPPGVEDRTARARPDPIPLPDAASSPATIPADPVSPEVSVLAPTPDVAAPNDPAPATQPLAILSDLPTAQRPGRWLTPPAAQPGVDVPVQAAADAPIPPETVAEAQEPTEISPLPVVAPTTPDQLLRDLLPVRLTEPAVTLTEREAEVANAFADILARQVGRGIAQGVVQAANTPTLDAVSPPTDVPQPDQTTDAATPDAPPIADPTVRTPLDQIEVRTAVDRALEAQAGSAVPGGANPVCLDEALFDPAAWLPPDEERPDFSGSRTAILGEFDRVDPAALETAVRYHIAHGFGAEARVLLDAFGTPPPLPVEDTAILRAMSHIVDGETGPPTAFLSMQLACPTRTALWGALATDTLAPDADYAPDAIIRGFESLPQTLRRSLGPELANRFLDIGDMDTVAALRRSIDRIGLPEDAASELAREPGALLEARVEAIEGRAEGSEDRLAEVARLDGPLAPEAVAKLIESQLSRDVVPDEAQIAAAGALAMEQRGSALGTRLRRAEILSHIARDDFDRAQAELQRAIDGGEIAPPVTAEIATAYLAAITARTADRAFLSRAPREVPPLHALGATAEVRQAAATRLLALGLPEMALPLVEDQATDRAARVLSAAAWLRLDEPGTALARLAGLEGDDVQRLRADAYGALGDLGASAGVLDAIGDTAGAAAAAWRAGDLRRVAQDPEGTRAAIAAVAVADDPVSPATPTSLAEHRDLIAEIARRREAIAGALSGQPATPQP